MAANGEKAMNDLPEQRYTIIGGKLTRIVVTQSGARVLPRQAQQQFLGVRQHALDQFIEDLQGSKPALA